MLNKTQKDVYVHIEPVLFLTSKVSLCRLVKHFIYIRTGSMEGTGSSLIAAEENCLNYILPLCYIILTVRGGTATNISSRQNLNRQKERLTE
jgi:hypothetical protein